MRSPKIISYRRLEYGGTKYRRGCSLHCLFRHRERVGYRSNLRLASDQLVASGQQYANPGHRKPRQRPSAFCRHTAATQVSSRNLRLTWSNSQTQAVLFQGALNRHSYSWTKSTTDRQAIYSPRKRKHNSVGYHETLSNLPPPRRYLLPLRRLHHTGLSKHLLGERREAVVYSKACKEHCEMTLTPTPSSAFSCFTTTWRQSRKLISPRGSRPSSRYLRSSSWLPSQHPGQLADVGNVVMAHLRNLLFVAARPTLKDKQVQIDV